MSVYIVMQDLRAAIEVQDVADLDEVVETVAKWQRDRSVIVFRVGGERLMVQFGLQTQIIVSETEPAEGTSLLPLLVRSVRPL